MISVRKQAVYTLPPRAYDAESSLERLIAGAEVPREEGEAFDSQDPPTHAAAFSNPLVADPPSVIGFLLLDVYRWMSHGRPPC